MGRLSRAEVIARSGVIATGHPLASAAGLRVLMNGGNAIDAAVAASAVLGVVQPMMSGLGGDTFAVVWRAADRAPWALNSSGVAPYAATVEWFTARGYRTMPLRGMLAAAVPGAVDAMTTALARWGSGRFTLGQLLQPAAAYAEGGFPVSPAVARWIAQAAETLARHPAAAQLYLPRGRPPQPGEILVNPDLARSLREVADGGADAFYRGPLARRMVAYIQARGGLLTEREFAEHRCEVYAPLSATYRGTVVYTTAPPSQGVIALEMLKILEGFAPADLRWGTADAVHLMVEAKKLAFADRLAYLGDPRYVTNPLDVLLSADYASRRREAIDPRRAAAEVAPGAVREAVGDTTALVAADAEGNVVCWITSLSSSFGCGEVVEGTGILLNNRAGRGFELTPGHPNCIGPGKRTMHTLMACLACRAGRPVLAWATPGGDGQPQWNVQVFSAIVDSGLGVQEAVEAPRWLSVPGTDPAGRPAPFELRLEPGFPPETVAELARRGHAVRDMGEMESGGACQAVLVDGDVYRAGSDSRVDGCAIGW